MEPPNKLKEWEQEEKQSKFNTPLTPNADFSGPVTQRHCTDCVCVPVFLLSNLALCALAGYCYYYGMPERLKHGWDFRAELCGVGELEQRKYTYFPAPLQSVDISMCLEGCPVTAARNSICYYEVDHTTEIVDTTCFTSYPSKPYFNHYCLPADELPREEVLSWLAQRQHFTTRALGDLYRAWDLLIIAGTVPCVVSLFYLLWLCCGRGLLVLAVISMLLLMAAFCALVYLTYEESWRIDDRICGDFHMVEMQSCSSEEETLPYRSLSFGLICLAALAVLGVIARVGKVAAGAEFLRLAVGPMKNSAWLAVTLLITVLFGAGLYCLFLTLLTYTVSVTTTDSIPSALVPGGELKSLTYSSTTRALVIFEFLMFLWWLSVLVHTVEFLAASFAATWFFSKDRGHLSEPVRLGLWNLVRYHLGSVLFAAVIVPVFRTPRQVMRTFKSILAVMNDKTQHCCASCCGPCFECYEVAVKYLNSQAIPYQVLWGHSFFESARRGFFLLSRSPPQALVPVHAAEFLLWVVQAAAILSSPLCVYYWVLHAPVTPDGGRTKNVNSVVCLAWIAGLFSWLVSELLLGFLRGLMYSEVVSYLVDKEMFVGVQRFSDISFSAIFHEEINLNGAGDKKASEKLFFTEESQQDLLFSELPLGVSSNRPFGNLAIESISSQPSFISDTSDEGHDFSLRPVTPVKAALSSAQDTARKLAPADSKRPAVSNRPIPERMTPDMSLSSFGDSENEEEFTVPAARPPTRGDTTNTRKNNRKGPRNL